jgi:broad specificity phosphatase PhoE
MVKLYLFRHGETDWNKTGRVQCGSDIELNENGIKQAERNAEILNDKGIECIHSSPLKEALKTAEILAKKINTSVEIVENLMEMKGGEWEGKLNTEIIELFGKNERGELNYEIFSYTKNEGLDLSFEGGEKKGELRNRIANAVINICEKTQHKIIAISSHGFALRELIRYTNFENDNYLENCEHIEAEYQNKNLKIFKRVKV